MSIDMDLSPEQLHFKDIIESQERNPQQKWGYPDSEGYCSLSPASSTDSYNFSPPHELCAYPEDIQSNFNTAQSQMEMLHRRTKSCPSRRSQKKRVVCNQRESASEREKMRMRNLSIALQNVRRYLPPAVAPAGKNLTKIETLRLTIRYIAHLSEVLGLDEETLVRRQEESFRGCNMCPVGLSCYQGRLHALASDPRATFPEPTSSPYTHYSIHDQTVHGSQERGIMLSSPQTYEEKAAVMEGETPSSFSPCVLSSRPVQETTQADTKEHFPSVSPISPDLGFCSNFIDDMWEDLQEKNLWTSFQPPVTQPHQFC